MTSQTLQWERTIFLLKECGWESLSTLQHFSRARFPAATFGTQVFAHTHLATWLLSCGISAVGQTWDPHIWGLLFFAVINASWGPKLPNHTLFFEPFKQMINDATAPCRSSTGWARDYCLNNVAFKLNGTELKRVLDLVLCRCNLSSCFLFLKGAILYLTPCRTEFLAHSHFQETPFLSYSFWLRFFWPP